MKTFNDIKTFERKLNKSLCWEDYIKIDGKLYYTYEYGGGSMFKMDYDYIYFLNKRTNTLIYIKYDCPSYAWKDGVKVQTKQYRFISLEVIKGATLWR